MGTGSDQGIINFSEQMKRKVKIADGQLMRTYGPKALQTYHARGQLWQDANQPMPGSGLQVPE
jgi:hypothetical protein